MGPMVTLPQKADSVRLGRFDFHKVKLKTWSKCWTLFSTNMLTEERINTYNVLNIFLSKPFENVKYTVYTLYFIFSNLQLALNIYLLYIMFINQPSNFLLKPFENVLYITFLSNLQLSLLILIFSTFSYI